MPYITIEEGDMFGVLDIVPETKETIIDQEIQRNFTVMALEYSDILCLSLEVTNTLLIRAASAEHSPELSIDSGGDIRAGAFPCWQDGAHSQGGDRVLPVEASSEERKQLR